MVTGNTVLCWAIIATGLFASSSLASAQNKSENRLGLATPIGVNIGRQWADDGKEGALLGVELSAVGAGGPANVWIGGFFGADLLLRSDATKLVVGVEAGLWPLGIDLGVLWSSLGKQSQWGFQWRFHLTAICSSLYIGTGLTKSQTSGEDWQPFALFGLLLKVPVLYPNGWPQIPLVDEPARPRPER